MIKYVSQCVGCEWCIPACPYKKVRVMICDCCGNEVDRLFWYEGEQLCEDCAIDMFKDTLEEVEDAEDADSD